jgi:hypothetical protein
MVILTNKNNPVTNSQFIVGNKLTPAYRKPWLFVNSIWSLPATNHPKLAAAVFDFQINKKFPCEMKIM